MREEKRCHCYLPEHREQALPAALKPRQRPATAPASVSLRHSQRSLPTHACSQTQHTVHIPHQGSLTAQGPTRFARASFSRTPMCTVPACTSARARTSQLHLELRVCSSGRAPSLATSQNQVHPLMQTPLETRQTIKEKHFILSTCKSL